MYLAIAHRTLHRTEAWATHRAKSATSSQTCMKTPVTTGHTTFATTATMRIVLRGSQLRVVTAQHRTSLLSLSRRDFEGGRKTIEAISRAVNSIKPIFKHATLWKLLAVLPAQQPFNLIAVRLFTTMRPRHEVRKDRSVSTSFFQDHRMTRRERSS